MDRMAPVVFVVLVAACAESPPHATADVFPEVAQGPALAPWADFAELSEPKAGDPSPQSQVAAEHLAVAGPMGGEPYLEPQVRVEPHPLVPGAPATVFYRGPLAPADALSMRYGWDGWSQVGGVDDAIVHRMEAGTQLYYHEVELEPVEGGFAITVDVPETAHALQMAFFTTDDAGAEAEVDDNAGLLYHWEGTFPYIGPYLTWNDVARPENGVVITWETSIPCWGTLLWGTDALDQQAMGRTFGTLHQVVLNDLEADTAYHYQVYDSAGNASEVYRFRTASADAERFTFVVAADMQDAGGPSQRWGDVSRYILQQDPAFLFMPGDLTADDHPGLWWLYFDRARDLLASVPSVPMLGNHETPGSASSPDTTSFGRYFDLPRAHGTEDFYSVSYGNTLLLALSTEVQEDLEPGAPQYDWVQEQLEMTWDEGERQVDWVFAGYHHPSYNAGKRFAGEAIDYRAVTELFDGNVDWVFQAHEHFYQRFEPIRAGEVVERYGVDGVDSGVGYIVTPAAGFEHLDNHVSSDPQADMLAYAETLEQGWLTVDVDPSSLQIASWAIGTAQEPLEPRVVDLVSYRRAE